MEGKGRKSKAEKRVLEGIIQKAKNWQLSFTKTPSHVSMPSHLISSSYQISLKTVSASTSL